MDLRKLHLIKSLPIFMGLSEKELTEIASTTHFAFKHHKKNKYIVSQGDDASEGLLFIITGHITIATEADNGAYNVQEEKIAQNMVIEPDKMFGLHPRYTSSYFTMGTSESMLIPKGEMLKLMQTYFIVQINFLNMLCTISQKQERLPWHDTPEDTESRIINFIRDHITSQAGKKVFRIKMTQLAKEINVPRIEVSIALNKLEEEEKIILQRGIITIPTPQLL